MKTLRKSPQQIKRALRDRGVTYGDVARLSGVTWNTVWRVINRRRTSSRVMAAIEKLVGDGSGVAQ